MAPPYEKPSENRRFSLLHRSSSTVLRIVSDEDGALLFKSLEAVVWGTSKEIKLVPGHSLVIVAVSMDTAAKAMITVRERIAIQDLVYDELPCIGT
jgi:hypothetical protein